MFVLLWDKFEPETSVWCSGLHFAECYCDCIFLSDMWCSTLGKKRGESEEYAAGLLQISMGKPEKKKKKGLRKKEEECRQGVNLTWDAGNPVFMQHQTDPRQTISWCTAQILSVQRFSLTPLPCCPSSCVKNKSMYLLLKVWTAISAVTSTSTQWNLSTPEHCLIAATKHSKRWVSQA